MENMKLPFINSLPFIYKFKSYANALTGEHEIALYEQSPFIYKFKSYANALTGEHEIALYGRLFAIYRLSVLGTT
jgi:hypothetical protein